MKNNFLTKLRRNKKGDLSINLLVMMTFLIMVSSVFLFLTSDTGVEEMISSATLEVNSVYQKQAAEFYASEIAEDVLIDSYYEIISINEYIGNPVTNPLEPEFLRVNPEINEAMNNFFYEKFKGNFGRVKETDDSDASYLRLLRQAVLDANKFKKSEVKSDENGVYFKISGVDFGTNSEKEIIDYRANLEIDATFEKVGLHSFQEIENAKDECIEKADAKEIENCMSEKLNNFYVVVEKKEGNDENKYLVKLQTERYYLLDGIAKRIDFKFIIQ